jgi:SAM-dependent methyltransferase
MYIFLKKLVKSFLPKRILERLEPFFRKIYAHLFFKGNNYRCNICENQFSRFIILPNEDKLCPFCGSLSRNRLLWKILQEEMKIQGRLLHFSPSRPLFRKLKKAPSIEYVSSDFEDEFMADKRYDITQIDEPDDKFDFIICYHVLEHIEKDHLAMSELYRVLKPNGTVFIQTPFKEGAIFEDFSIQSKEGRLKYFGQEDHVRIYSVNGLKERLQTAGFQIIVKKHQFKKEEKTLGLRDGEVVLFAKKITT